MKTIYLDAASTTQPKNEIVNAILPYLIDKWYNPSALYSRANQVKKEINSVRSIVAKEINAKSNEIFFTSGASESNNWVIRGFDDINHSVRSNLVLSPIEHKSSMDAVCNTILSSDIHFCKVQKDGMIDLNSLEEILKQIKGTKILVSIIMAHNEIGTVQDIKTLSEVVHRYGGILHTDATQALGQISIDVEELGIDMLSASAQKLGGIKGCGFLYKRNSVKINPLIYGSQENELRGGTENVIGIISLGKAIEMINYKNINRISELRDLCINRLQENLNCTLNGSRFNRLPNNINLTLHHKMTGESLIYMLDTCGIYISSGSACNSHSLNPSYVLQAIGLSDNDIYKTIRISLNEHLTLDETNKSISEIIKQVTLLDKIHDMP